MSKVFGVIALKGGVGKTTVAVNLGATLAEEYNKRVLIIDANFSTPHLGLHLGVINPKYTLHSVLNNEYPIFEAIYRHPLGFHIIPGKLSPNQVDTMSLKDKIAPLRDIYDIIILDSSPSLNEEMASTMAASDEIIVVSSPDYPTLSSTLHAIKIAKEQNTPIRGIIINKVRNKSFELSEKEIADTSEVEVLASLPDEIKVLASLSKMTPLVSHSPKNHLSKTYRKLAGNLIGEKKASTFSKIKKAIKNKFSKNKRGGK